ncbi:MAG: Ubiquinone/menaquinone biosynthesis C-methyltransferase UbiE [Bryobacteraceae bacterium]|nr:Ubiquinone/menaquinone biosynthesis C-methyltransferase UbiE [Bryobacteraceae bacterium]
MASILHSLRLLTEPTRLRILLLLESEELSVAELQQILTAGQSSISTHLAQLRQTGLIEDRRTGKSTLYSLSVPPSFQQLMDVLRQAAAEIPEAAQDQAALRLVLNKRQDRMRAYFDQLAGRFGRHYVPGRSWKAVAELLLQLMPPMVIADLGAGEGTLSQLLAQRAKQVIAVDNSEKMVEFGSELARTHGVGNLVYRKGDLEALPIEDGAADLALFSQSLHHAQHPRKAVEEAWRILRPGGRIAILDLARHHYEQARELYADVWLGFTEVELTGHLEKAGFGEPRTMVVHKEDEAPYFETVLAVAWKPGARGG